MNQQRNITLDILRIVMAFMVIGSHGGFLREFGQFARYIYVSGIVRIAVPIFLITNGYFFYKSVHRDPSKWLIRAAKLYIVWMLIYAFYWIRIDAYNVRSLCKLAAIIIMGYGHLWYISAMIGAAVMVLLLRRKMSDCGMMLIAFGLFFCGVLIQYIGNCHVFQGSFVDTPLNMLWVYRNFLFLGFPFFVFGFLANQYDLSDKMSYSVLIICVVMGLCFLIIESYLNYSLMSDPEIFDLLISLVLVCPAIFLLAIKTSIAGPGKNLALMSSAVYFVHLFFTKFLSNFSGLSGTSITLIAIVLSVAASCVLIAINKKLKFLL